MALITKKAHSNEHTLLKNEPGEFVPLTLRPNLRIPDPGMGPNGDRLHRMDGTEIRSGDQFVFTITDPVNKPLPLWKILTLQWQLQRAAAMAGGADKEEEDDNNNDNDSEGSLNV
ncbi:hypothetical protein BGW36DRAFT_443468 [Talaromyces proteolyticus]|uniref:Uncharacterized protein n=1 Tax=Talaromyces proteolyticus TaxID=1131652 RepID=A0AAD4KXG2_9EURO|nr:uncharacterized protein BGW36DRAFT_443468 [Talaromyces proteolyticus]KAH8703331.1 hypothetical protein BGW36DRAFT_443468 [Talaromyces proteolyticus]